jgi:hypothetical protein
MYTINIPAWCCTGKPFFIYEFPLQVDLISKFYICLEGINAIPSALFPPAE